MFLDLFIVPSNKTLNHKKAERAVQSSVSVVGRYWQASDWQQINSVKKTSLYYGVIYDREWFDPRLIKDLSTVLVSNLNIDMFSLFCVHGDGEIRFEPRIFSSCLLLNPDIPTQPLPHDHEKLNFEKLIGGWLYVD